MSWFFHRVFAPPQKRFLRNAFALVAFIPSLGWGVDEAWIANHETPLEGLFTSLSESPRPEIDEITKKWAAGHRVDACTQLVAYYRERKSLLAGLEPSLTLSADGRPLSDAWISGIISPLGFETKLERLSDGSVNWHQKGPNNDKEFAWMLNRHLILPLFVSAHQRSEPSADAPYLKAAEALIIDWVTNNPYPDRLTFSPPWRALEVARRILDSWAPSFDFLRQNLNDEALLLLLSSLPNHADALSEHASIWGGNHLLTEKITLVIIALQWPEFSDAEAWLHHGLETVASEFIKQTYPDGAYIELSNHYQKIVLQNIQHLFDVLHLSDRTPPEELLRRVESAWDFYAKTSKPDGSGPLNNDSDFEQGRPLIKEAATFYNRSDWLYIATNGEEGVRSAYPSSSIFPWAGISILRDSYERTSDWLYFNTGPYGTAHQHDDTLHLSVVLRGEDFLVDQGRNSYFPDKWRDYFTGPAGHNMAELEGLEPRKRPHKRRTPIDPTLLKNEAWSVVWGEHWYDSAPPGERPSWLHRRFVVHQRNNGYIIIDHLIGFGSQPGVIRWHFDPRLQRPDIEARFQLASVSTQTPAPIWNRGSVDPVAGWHSKQYDEKETAWQADYEMTLAKPEVFIWTIGESVSANVGLQNDRVRITRPTGTLILDMRDPRAEWEPAQ